MAWHQSASRATIEQFTGLKDKNGVEIYEVDIVKVSEFVDRGNGYYDDETFIVQWDDEHCALMFFENCYLSSIDVMPCEVISSIHESKELKED